jgi:hypothetical protein
MLTRCLCCCPCRVVHHAAAAPCAAPARFPDCAVCLELCVSQAQQPCAVSSAGAASRAAGSAGAAAAAGRQPTGAGSCTPGPAARSDVQGMCRGTAWHVSYVLMFGLASFVACRLSCQGWDTALLASLKHSSWVLSAALAQLAARGQPRPLDASQLVRAAARLGQQLEAMFRACAEVRHGMCLMFG